AHLYPKGAVVLHMMRFVLGDKPFTRAMSHFLHKHAFEPVDTHDLMKAIKEATGQNLDWFFEQWLFRPGHPVFDISYVWNEQNKKLTLTVIQTQDTTQNVPIFKTPVNIGIVTADTQVTKRLWLAKKKEQFVFDLLHKPLLVRFDQGNFLLKEWTFTKSVDELLYQLNHDDVIGRSWAASELKKFKDDPRSLSALRASAKNDPFWYVRKTAIESMAVFHPVKQIAFLQNKSRDKNSKVRAAALKVLGDFKNLALLEFFIERFKNDDSYLAQAEALRAVGKCGVSSAKKFLQKTAKMHSPRNVIQRAAKWALEQMNN
ncbi:MAG: HEAT repeat domain-containing protein, partial [bacterium]